MSFRTPLAGALALAFAAALPTLPAAAEDQPAADGLGRTVLVLDSSGSMAEPAGGGQSKIQAAKAALRRVVTALPDDAPVGLRVFGAEVFSRTDPGACEDSQLVVEPGTGNRQALLEAIDGYEPYGETPIPHALREAAADLGEAGPRSIVLVSDGESTCRPDPCVVASQIVQQGIDLHIDVVGLSVSGRAREQLRCIAERGGGTYYDADDAAAIEATLTRVAERALRPFTLSGDPISGGPQDDPAPLGLGDWIDNLGPVGTAAGVKYYRFTREQADTTLRVSAVTQGGRGEDGLSLEIRAPDGSICDYGLSTRLVDTRRIVGVQAIAGPETECGAPGDYEVFLERRQGDRGEVPVGLRVTEEPPVTDVGFVGDGEIEVGRPAVAGTPRRAPGGQAFVGATEIGPGSWRGTLVPGEAAMYRLPLDFGQGARIAVTFPRPGDAELEAIDGDYMLGHVVLYNPMQAELAAPDDATISGRVGTDEAVTLLTGIPPVSRALLGTGGVNGVRDVSMAGDHYLAISATTADHSVEVPVVVEVEMVGAPAEGPSYADGATWSVADGTSSPPAAEETPDATEETASGPRSDAEDGGPLLPTGVALGVGGLGVVALLAAGLLWRRRRG